MDYHTNLRVLLTSILFETEKFNWVVADLEYNPDYTTDLPVDHEQDYFILSSNQFQKLVYANVQIIWGVFLGFPASIDIQVSKNELPFVKFNDIMWQNGNIQNEDAVIEIDCFDSSYTIVKFKDHNLSDNLRFISRKRQI